VPLKRKEASINFQTEKKKKFSLEEERSMIKLRREEAVPLEERGDDLLEKGKNHSTSKKKGRARFEKGEGKEERGYS